MRYTIAAAALLLLSGPANTATVTRAFEVTTTSFRNFSGDTAPFASLVATFQLTYDDTGLDFFGSPDYFRATTDGASNAGPFSATPTFGYFQPSAFSTTPRLAVGGTINGMTVLANGTNDFALSFDAGAMLTGYAMLSLTTADKRLAFVSTDARVIELPVVTAVPEPSAWTMMILGFGAIGLTLRRRSVSSKWSSARGWHWSSAVD